VTASAFTNTLQEAIARPVLTDLAIALMVFDPHQEAIIQWNP
jgi:hypothetical protein